MAKTLPVEIVEREFTKNDKVVKYNALTIKVKTLDGEREIVLSATNLQDKFYLKEYLKTLK